MHIPAELLARLLDAGSVGVLTGAGASSESGVPTFRDAQTGLWAKFRPEDLATPEAFQRDPVTVWRWYQSRRQQLGHVEPHAGHIALAELQALLGTLTVITQNVDGLHQRAGQKDVIELHGNINRDICSRERVTVVGGKGEPPLCPSCGAAVRPDVVWFGEALPEEALYRAMDVARDCDVFLSVGTSTLVQPAASLPFLALDTGSMVVEINPAETPLSADASIRLPGLSGEVLPALLLALRQRKRTDPVIE